MWFSGAKDRVVRLVLLFINSKDFRSFTNKINECLRLRATWSTAEWKTAAWQRKEALWCLFFVCFFKCTLISETLFHSKLNGPLVTATFSISGLGPQRIHPLNALNYTPANNARLAQIRSKVWSRRAQAFTLTWILEMPELACLKPRSNSDHYGDLCFTTAN